MARDVLQTLIDKIIVEGNPEGGHLLHIAGDLSHALNAEAPGMTGRLVLTVMRKVRWGWLREPELDAGERRCGAHDQTITIVDMHGLSGHFL